MPAGPQIFGYVPDLSSLAGTFDAFKRNKHILFRHLTIIIDFFNQFGFYTELFKGIQDIIIANGQRLIEPAPTLIKPAPTAH